MRRISNGGDLVGAAGAVVATLASFGCALHCALLPVALSVLPTALPHLHVPPLVERGLMAFSLLFAVSLLVPAYRRHRRRLPLALLFAGALAFGCGWFLHEQGNEYALWPGMVGGLTVATAHLVNRRCLTRCG